MHTDRLVKAQDDEQAEPLKITEEHYKPIGEVISPDFPNNYPVNCFATYRIFTDAVVKVSISTSSFKALCDSYRLIGVFICDRPSPNSGEDTRTVSQFATKRP